MPDDDTMESDKATSTGDAESANVSSADEPVPMDDNTRNDVSLAEQRQQARDVTGKVSQLGATLRDAREAAHLSIGQVAAELCIAPNYLVALEEERFEAIGPPVFTKGYLRSYCEFLRLDYSALLPIYEANSNDELPPLIGRRSVGQPAKRNGINGFLVGLGVVVFLALVALWYFGGSMS